MEEIKYYSMKFNFKKDSNYKVMSAFSGDVTEERGNSFDLVASTYIETNEMFIIKLPAMLFGGGRYVTVPKGELESYDIQLQVVNPKEVSEDE